MIGEWNGMVGRWGGIGGGGGRGNTRVLFCLGVFSPVCHSNFLGTRQLDRARELFSLIGC